MLPNLAPERRESAAKAYLELRGGALAEAARAALAAKVLATIGAPELSDLFGPGSRGEVSLTGLLPRPGRPDLPFNGRLDRLVVTGGGLLIVDFKLGGRPFRADAAHVVQLALYRAALAAAGPGRCRSAPRSSISMGRRSRRSAKPSLTRRSSAGRGGLSALSTPRTPIFTRKSEANIGGCLDEVAFAGQGRAR